MKSKKALFEFLARNFNKTDVRIGNHFISDETYGKTSCIYLWNIKKIWGMTHGKFVQLLRQNGFKVNPNYGTDGCKRVHDATEVTVSYFKGWHWDE